MDDAVIKVENLYKKYSRNAQNHLNYGMTDLLREIAGKHRHSLRKDEFYAVNDVSFELTRGDSFALIGRNGSGKTTVLKMLNGLIKPDGGRITMNGRVQALINLGAGFSPRLSGRENIFNSASLMGLTHQEISGLLDSIIDFSELEDSIDSPIGTYSSGMAARLGFAVAVHLQPDILLIDEILAVGDFAFQNKCYTRMEQLKRDGVTIVMVSHSHGKVIQLCERAIWMHEGRPMFSGSSQESVKAYLRFLEELEQAKLEKRTATPSKSIRDESPTPSENTADSPDKDPGVRFAISEPKTTEPEIHLSPTQKEFRLSGWYTAPESKLIDASLNGEILEVQSVPRPDVEANFPEADFAGGFALRIQRRDLAPSNTFELRIGGAVYWSKTILADDGEVPTRALAKSGLYGPVYTTDGLIDDISGVLLVNGDESPIIPIHSAVEIQYSYRLLKPVRNLHMTFNFFRKDGTLIAAIPSLENGLHRHITTGVVDGTISIPDFDFVPGSYVIMMPVCEGKKYLTRDVLMEFMVTGDGQMFWGITDLQCEHDVVNRDATAPASDS